MAEGLPLYTCSIDDGWPKLHSCRRAHEALDEAGHPDGNFVTGSGDIVDGAKANA